MYISDVDGLSGFNTALWSSNSSSLTSVGTLVMLARCRFQKSEGKTARNYCALMISEIQGIHRTASNDLIRISTGGAYSCSVLYHDEPSCSVEKSMVGHQLQHLPTTINVDLDKSQHPIGKASNMSLLDPPSFSQRKRKRSITDPINPSSSQSSQLPPNAINPLSHSPSTIRQFALAGLSETDTDPAQRIPDFPHRGLDRGAAGRNVEPDSDEESEQDDQKKPKKKSREAGRGGHFEVLLQSIHQFLDQGDIEKAARAYGLLLQLRPLGGPVDIRHHSLWAIGAEILMREGEDKAQKEEFTEEVTENLTATTPRRWGRAANMNKVKAYFDTLIQQHPYDYRRPRNISAVDFWLAMLSCEVYNTHTEHVMALSRLNEAARDWDEEDPSFESFGDEGFKTEESGEREARLKRRQDELRLQALATMGDITKRMDGLMRDLPYSKNEHFLRLRAMASLYVADLVLPVVDVSLINIEEAQRRRLMEQRIAQDCLKKIIDNGGELDEGVLSILAPQNEDDEEPTMPLYSSLPIRGL